MRENKSVGIALGGGGARGWAHIGVLEVLEERGVDVAYVSGTSIGSVVGAIYAAGNLPMLKDATLALDWRDILYYFLEVNVSFGGMIDGKRIVEFIRENVQVTHFRELKKPFQCTATNIKRGTPEVFSEGDLLEAIRASIAIPGIFTPVIKDEKVLVDGGVVNPVPVEQARNMGADIVIAVDINASRLEDSELGGMANEEAAAESEAMRNSPLMDKFKGLWKGKELSASPAFKKWFGNKGQPNLFELLGNSIIAMEAQIAEGNYKKFPPDVLIKPQVAQYTFVEFNKADALIQAGRNAMEAAWGELEEKLI